MYAINHTSYIRTYEINIVPPDPRWQVLATNDAPFNAEELTYFHFNIR